MFYNESGIPNINSNMFGFSQIGKDLQTVLEKIVENENIMKLLYYGEKNALSKDNLSATIKLDMINDYIRVVPILPKDYEAKNYIIIQFDNFSPSYEDSLVYKEFVLTFDVFCNSKNWILDNYQLRPYAIMNELDRIFNMSKLNSSGPINFIGANAITIDENLMGFSLAYKIYDYR